MGIGFITDITIKQQQQYFDHGDTGMKPKHFLKRGMRYTSGCDPIQTFWDRDRKIARGNFGRRGKSTGFIYLNGSKICEAGGPLTMRSCLQYTVINSAPLELENTSKNRNCTDSALLEE